MGITEGRTGELWGDRGPEREGVSRGEGQSEGDPASVSGWDPGSRPQARHLSPVTS